MTVLYSQTITTPLGQMLITASTRGVCLAEFAGTQRMERESRDLERLFQARTEPGGNEHTAQATQELGEYFRGERQRFTVALDTPGTDFQRQVWAALRDIPYGTISHYQALAATIGKPAAVRAVAAANGANRVAIRIPCHRIIGKDGTLTGYGGGLPRKAWLLAHERGGRNHSLPDWFATLQEHL